MISRTRPTRAARGQAPRRRLRCSPVIGMTASWQPNGHRDTGPDPRGWAPVTGSRHSRPGPLGRRESSPGRRLRRGPALEAAKTCSQEKSSSLAAAAAAAGRRGLAFPASRPPQQSCPTHTRSEQPAMYVSLADNITRHRARPVKATRHSREVARNVAATLPRLTGRSRASGLRPSEITRQCSRRPPTIALHHNN